MFCSQTRPLLSSLCRCSIRRRPFLSRTQSQPKDSRIKPLLTRTTWAEFHPRLQPSGLSINISRNIPNFGVSPRRGAGCAVHQGSGCRSRSRLSRSTCPGSGLEQHLPAQAWQPDLHRSRRCGQKSSKPANSCWAAARAAEGQLGFTAVVGKGEGKICFVFPSKPSTYSTGTFHRKVGITLEVPVH